ncbi:VQ motif-containing protein 19-like [Wolffia australiana]
MRGWATEGDINRKRKGEFISRVEKEGKVFADLETYDRQKKLKAKKNGRRRGQDRHGEASQTPRPQIPPPSSFSSLNRANRYTQISLFCLSLPRLSVSGLARMMPMVGKSGNAPLQTSPRAATSCNSSTSTSNSATNGGPRNEASTYPTTFVHADSSSFKQVVQMLTGSAETTSRHSQTAPTAKTGPKKASFKLYERRHGSFKSLKSIGLSPRMLLQQQQQQPEMLSPSVLDFPALALSSPVTPLLPELFNRAPKPGSPAGSSAEERAIAEKGFYLHPSPRAIKPGAAEAPRLLPLFPVSSPRASY